MATITFSSLPAEIHGGIAILCNSNDLANLCLTSKLMNQRCVRALYRHVDLQFDQQNSDSVPTKREFALWRDAQLKRQQRFVNTLLSHPEYGRYILSLKQKLFMPGFISHRRALISREELWRAMELLKHVQNLDLGFEYVFAQRITIPIKQIPKGLFTSATSVRLVGHMPYGLPKSILDAINPATLQHLCLDMVHDFTVKELDRGYLPGTRGEDGRIIAFGGMSGLLTPLTGRCTALRTLTLRRAGPGHYRGYQGYSFWSTAAEEACYREWASFLRSVKRSVEEFTFEQTQKWLRDYRGGRYSDVTPLVMDERFQKFLLPILTSENWPCLTSLELRGVMNSLDHIGNAELMVGLRAVHGEDTTIVVEEEASVIAGLRMPHYRK